jgi:hypothetical protein
LSKNLEEFEKTVAQAQKKCEALYIKEIRSILKRCPSLDYFMDAMGAQFFVRKDGEIVHNEEELPPIAREFYYTFAERYLDQFSSLGYKVWIDRLG